MPLIIAGRPLFIRENDLQSASEMEEIGEEKGSFETSGYVTS